MLICHRALTMCFGTFDLVEVLLILFLQYIGTKKIKQLFKIILIQFFRKTKYRNFIVSKLNFLVNKENHCILIDYYMSNQIFKAKNLRPIV